MMRLAAVLALLALVVLLILVSHLSGATAILFVFVGMPALALALAIYFVERWRQGAFRFNETTRLT